MFFFVFLFLLINPSLSPHCFVFIILQGTVPFPRIHSLLQLILVPSKCPIIQSVSGEKGQGRDDLPFGDVAERIVWMEGGGGLSAVGSASIPFIAIPSSTFPLREDASSGKRGASAESQRVMVLVDGPLCSIPSLPIPNSQSHLRRCRCPPEKAHKSAFGQCFRPIHAPPVKAKATALSIPSLSKSYKFWMLLAGSIPFMPIRFAPIIHSLTL